MKKLKIKGEIILVEGDLRLRGLSKIIFVVT